MSKDAASSTPKAGRKPPQKSMIAAGGPEGREPSGPGGPTSRERAQEMRAALGLRQEAEALLADASQLRQRAAADADTMVAEAETLAGELVDEAQSRSDQLVAQAQERADGILARARSEAEELERQADAERERLRAEIEAALRADVEAERERVGSVLTQARTTLRDLAPALAAAETTVTDVVDALGALLPEEPPAATAPAEGTLVPAGPQEVAVEDDPTGEASEPGAAEAADARPLGWLFRNSQA